MILTILGSGTCVPNKSRNPPGYLIEAGKELLIFDTGSGILRQLTKNGTDFMKINHIFYSHLHPDHIADMIPILQAMYVSIKYMGKEATKEINLYGPQGFPGFYKKIKETMLPVNDVRTINAIEFADTVIGGVKITSAEVLHSNSSIAYRIEHNKKSVVYSGDTDYCESLVKLCRNADAAILECSFPDKKIGHLTPAEAATIAAQANVKTLILSHFYPVYDNYDIKKEARKHFKGKIVLAKDLMKINI